MKKSQENVKNTALEELFEAFLLLKTNEEVARFMKDLCTPQEMAALAERWRVCKLLDQSELSYREIHQMTGVSLATITRIARFLKTEPHQGYALVLYKIQRQHKK
ncbi:YerC/YecD family TrpR-related protein [Candidatus Dependentiae bacterium]|nr:YerC/YecD family TrpR-related protein [Candidatus Dependentiae bacterium]